MSNQVINSALASRLKNMGLPTHFLNAQFTPTVGTLYLKEDFMPARTNSPGLAPTDTRDFKGIYQVSVYAPRDATKKAGMDTATLVEAHFSRDTFLNAAGSKVTGANPAKVVHCENVYQSGGLLVGDRWMVPVTVEYRGLFR